MTVEIDLTDGLLRDMASLLMDYRCAPRHKDVSTPELMALAMRDERELSNETIKALLRLLGRHRPSALDCDITEQMDAFARRALDAARVEEL